MNGKDLYPLVYKIVKRAQAENPKLRQFVNYYDWSQRIPKPADTTEELADALCTSVSSSAGVGLEIYFQEKVYLHDLQSEHLASELSYHLGEIDTAGNNYQTLGQLIRTAFEGRKVPNQEDLELLRNM